MRPPCAFSFLRCLRWLGQKGPRWWSCGRVQDWRGLEILDLKAHSMIGSWKPYNVLFAKSTQKKSIPQLVTSFFGRGPRIVTSLLRLALICWKEDVSRKCWLIYFGIHVFHKSWFLCLGGLMGKGSYFRPTKEKGVLSC